MSPLLFVAVVSSGNPPELAPPPRMLRVGRVVLTGNDHTPDRAVLKLLPLFPGEPLPPAVVFQTAERKLLVKFAGRFDLDAGRWPTVVARPAERDSAFVDVVVSFPERSSLRPVKLPSPQLPARR